MFLVDSHCHLDGLDYQTLHKNVDDVLAKAAARDVKFCLAVATTLPGYRSMRELVGRRDNVVFSCGVHPLNQDEAYEVETLRTLAAEEGVVAMGETGLDYFYTPETKAQQQTSFRDHIRIGRELNKPVIAFAGLVGEGIEELYALGFTRIIGINPPGCALQDALNNAEMHLENAAAAFIDDLAGHD